MIQIYHGDGKGKTTAAIGLAIRAAGHGIPVVFAQFLKDESSGEISVLKQIPGIEVLHSECFHGFIRNMTNEQKQETREAYAGLLETCGEIIASIGNTAEQNMNSIVGNSQENTSANSSLIRGVIILDEVLHACNYDLLDEAVLIDKLEKWKKVGDNCENCEYEVILTGRNPSQPLLRLADYVTEMKKEKHPFDRGIYAREGIEL